MKVLFIAPQPPPINGQSILAKRFLDALHESNYETDIVDFSKDSHVDGIDSVGRIVEVLRLIGEVRRKQRTADKIYLQISESLAGNFKDLCFFFVCRKKLDRMYIQLHGGTINSNIYQKYSLLYRLNRYFISRLGGVLVSGTSHLPTFDDKIDASRIRIIPNFAKDDLFVEERVVTRKFDHPPVYHILYMSSLIPMKGYLLHLEAIERMAPALRARFHFDFAGGFANETDKADFLRRIEAFPNVEYHGLVSGEAKQQLFARAHALCLPTLYFEGQSVCVLEAYAAGCYVITTAKGGLVDVFTDQVNGYRLAENSNDSIIEAHRYLLDHPAEVAATAQQNRLTALQLYKPEAYDRMSVEALHLTYQPAPKRKTQRT